jgi:hypothetical protein
LGHDPFGDCEKDGIALGDGEEEDLGCDGGVKEGGALSDGEHIRGEELELLAAGALPEPEAAAIQAHVCGCVECGAELAEARAQRRCWVLR